MFSIGLLRLVLMSQIWGIFLCEEWYFVICVGHVSNTKK